MAESKGFTRLAGMEFREPDWADEVFVSGYPNVPMVAEMLCGDGEKFVPTILSQLRHNLPYGTTVRAHRRWARQRVKTAVAFGGV